MTLQDTEKEILAMGVTITNDLDLVVLTCQGFEERISALEIASIPTGMVPEYFLRKARSLKKMANDVRVSGWYRGDYQSVSSAAVDASRVSYVQANQLIMDPAPPQPREKEGPPGIDVRSTKRVLDI